jgi:hypothetical protein
MLARRWIAFETIFGLSVLVLGMLLAVYSQNAHASSIQVQSGFFYGNVRTATSTDTMSVTDFTVLDDTTSGAFTESLPASPIKGQVVNVKLINSTNTLTISGNGKTIDGSSSITTSTTNQSYQIQYNGTNWFII